MSESLSDLERDVEESRARLDQTIDRIQDRLTPRNLVDEMIGSARQTPLNTLYDSALETVRRNPVPVLLIATGIGMLLNRLSKGQAASAAAMREAESTARVGVLPEERVAPLPSASAAARPRGS